MYLREAIEKALLYLNKEKKRLSHPLTSYFSFERDSGGINCPDRNIVSFQGPGKANEGIVTISMRGMDRERDNILIERFSSERELLSILEEWKEAIYWWQSRISFYRLEEGRSYFVAKDFTDLDGRSYKKGDSFTLLSKDVFAKEEGYTLRTSSGILRLQGQANFETLENLDLYIVEANNA